MKSIQEDEIVKKACNNRLNFFIHGLDESNEVAQLADQKNYLSHFKQFLKNGLKLTLKQISIVDIHKGVGRKIFQERG